MKERQREWLYAAIPVGHEPLPIQRIREALCTSLHGQLCKHKLKVELFLMQDGSEA
jgi:hypothetical protein